MKWKDKNISDHKKSPNITKSVPTLSKIGLQKENLPQSRQEEDIGDTLDQKFSQKKMKITRKGKFVTVGSPVLPKEKTCRDKSNSSNKNTLTTKLSKILDQASTQKEKDLIPFWTQESKEISEKLWLPTETDCVESTLISSKVSSKSTPKERSWFSIKKRHLQKKNWSEIYSPSSLSFPEDSMDSEVIPSKGKLKSKPLKTLKMRIFPNQPAKETLRLMFDQYRWYYNAILQITEWNHMDNDGNYDKRKYSFYYLRDLLRKHEYQEKHVGNICFREFVLNEERNDFPLPDWWKSVHNRIPRGAVAKFTSSLNSAISNKKNRNCRDFEMKFMSRKSPIDYLHFEDKSFPSFIKEIESRYWFTTQDRRRVSIPYSEIESQKGLEVIYEKETGRYFLHVPVERDWFPEEDRRRENQAKYTSNGNHSVISLDPGVRKFLVGYDPEGKCYIIGKGAQRKLSSLLKEVDKTEKPYLLWKKIKNLISEIHWKVSSFLVKNYDTILLPDFRISQMVRKGKKLGKMTRRLLNMFSFYKFKEKLQYKCSTYGKKLLIVDESFTSCTCGVCGEINRMGGNEVYLCQKCGLEIDRDVTGARNILIKNSTLR